MIPKSGYRFSEKIMLQNNEHDPEKWVPVFGEDHAPAILMHTAPPVEAAADRTAR
jgi:hypothetical protein